MSRIHRELRVGTKYLRHVSFVAISIVLAVSVWIGWMVVTAFPGERTTIIASVSPLVIQSWDQKRKILTVLPIPDDVRVEGASGVGLIPVSSLAALERMDTAKKGILARSLTLALATPVMSEELAPPLRLRFFLAVRAIRPDAIKTIDLAALGVYRPETLADGTPARVFDADRFDAMGGWAFEIDSVRREELRVRVVNTTDVVGLGSRAARILSHAGLVVVAVESEQRLVQACAVHAKKHLWSSQSVRFIKDAFSCTVTDAQLDERVDATIWLGSAYSSS